jgi:uncharacterized protein YkwD
MNKLVLPAVLLVSFGAVLGSLGTDASRPAADQVPLPSVSMEMSRDSLLREINEARLGAGVPQYPYDATLQDYVDERLRQLQKAESVGDFCSHQGFFDMGLADEVGRAVSENLVCNAPSLEAAIQAWMASPTHRDAMLSTRYRHVTIATDGRNAVTLFSTDPN